MSSFYSDEDLKKMGFKKIGKNVLLSKNASIYSANKISIGDNVRIDDFCILSGNITLGNYIHISASTLLFGGENGIIMKDFTGISSRSAIYADTDDYSGNALTNPMVPNKFRNVFGGPVVLEKHVLVGTGTTILPNITIGEGSSIGCMSLVNKSLNSWGIYVGIPCKKIKDRSKKIIELEEKMLDEKYNT